MPKWGKDQKEFEVAVYQAGANIRINLPKPLWDLLKEPKKVKFKVGKNGKITILA